MRKFTTLLVLLTLFVSSTMAQQVSVTEAMSRAKAYLQSSTSSRSKSLTTPSDVQLSLAYTCQDTSNKNVCFYIFNGDDSFVIVGGDEAAQQILGYSDNGTFDYATAPANLKWWLSQYQQQIGSAIEYAAANPSAAAKAGKAQTQVTETGGVTVGPLLQTTWNQGTPYNNAINAVSGRSGKEAFVTGCVATAMAQVMNYHKCPATNGTGSHSYTCQTNTDFSPSADFSATTYDWANMLDSYGSYTEDEANAVATLMYHAGISVDMDYNSETNGSSAYSHDVPDALVNYFGYDKSLRFEQREYFTDEDWEDMVKNEIVNYRPVIYSGKATKGGHSFVCDGYNANTKLFHFNWGWGGYQDCWCAMTGTDAIMPHGSGTGGAGDDAAYTTDQQIVIGVKADAGGVESPILCNLNKILSIVDGSNNYTNYDHAHGTSKTLKLQENIWNQSRSISLHSFTLRVKAIDTTTGYEYYFTKTQDINLLKDGYSTYSVAFDVNELAYNGTYKLKMICRTGDNDWYDVETALDAPTVTITGATDPVKTDVSFSISANSVQATQSIQISHSTTYNGSITYTSSNPDVATVDADGVVNGVSVGSATITATAAGSLYFNETTQSFDITVTPFVKKDATATISTTEMVVGQTAQVSITDGYDGTPAYTLSKEGVVTVNDAGLITASAKGSVDITVTLPETDNYNGYTTTFTVNVSEASLIFSKAPYFSNDNNPWEKDVVLHMPLYNGSESTFNGKFVAKIHLSGGGVLNYTCSMGNLVPGASYDYVINLNGYLTYFEDGVNTPFAIEFYSDEAGTIPFNIPSITYTYRPPLDYDYTLSDAGIGTIILPFNADIPSGCQLYECNSMDGNTLVLTEATTLKRNTPYIIEGAAGTYSFSGPKAIDDTPVLFGDGYLKGTMLEGEYLFTTKDYILQKQNDKVAFYRYTEESGEWDAAPYRAFLQTKGNDSKSYSYAAIPDFNSNDIPTAITTVSGDVKAAGIYSLGGVKQKGLQPGFNIIVDEQGNTTKVFIKK